MRTIRKHKRTEILSTYITYFFVFLHFHEINSGNCAISYTGTGSRKAYKMRVHIWTYEHRSDNNKVAAERKHYYWKTHNTEITLKISGKFLTKFFVSALHET